MAGVRWTPQAAGDLEAICLFIGRDSPGAAAILADRVLRAVERLANHPRLGRVVPETHEQSIRELIVGGYRVIYRLQDENVHLLTVYHGARSLEINRVIPEP